MPKNELDLTPLIKLFQQEKKTLPAKLGNGAVKFFRSNFDREGFLDRSVSKWKRRKYRPRGGQKKILTVSGRLKRSIRRLQTSWGRIVIGSKGVIYAERHNEGLKGMPKRQFIGESATLEKAIKKRIEKEIRNFEPKLK